MSQKQLPVIIRYEGHGKANRKDWHINDVVAMFPTEPGSNDPHSMSCYSIGQHTSCLVGYIGSKTKSATPEQVEAMLAHLRRVGYDNLKVVARASSWHAKARREALKR